MNKQKVDILYNDIMRKLNESIKGTADFKEGQIMNPLAPCLIRSVMMDLIMMKSEINKK